MRETRILYFALAVLLVVSLGAVSVHEHGIGFSDGTFMSTVPGLTASQILQGQVQVSLPSGSANCTSESLLHVASQGSRFLIDWLVVESKIRNGVVQSHPANVDLIVETSSGDVNYPVAQLLFAHVFADGQFLRARWAGPVRVYSEVNSKIWVRLCFNDTVVSSEPVGNVSFSGYVLP